MKSCPYRHFGCDFQAANGEVLDDHLAEMARINDDEHPFRYDLEAEEPSLKMGGPR